MHKKDLHVGDEVLMPWGVGEVRGTVQEIYGRHPRVHGVDVVDGNSASSESPQVRCHSASA